MSELRLQLRIGPPDPPGMGNTYQFQALVDGRALWDKDEDIACLASFLESLSGSGRYFLLNCSCGFHSCGGYYKGVDVQFDGDTVTLTNMDSPNAPPLSFRAEQYRSEVRRALTEAKAQIPSELTQMHWPCGDDASILGLDPYLVSLSVPVQRAHLPGGVFFRREDVFQAWLADTGNRALAAQRQAEFDVRRSGLNLSTEDGMEEFSRKLAQWWERENELDAEDWYREHYRS